MTEGRAPAAGIAGARLATIPACGHMLATEAEATAPRAVREHLAGRDVGEAGAASFAA